MIVPLCWNPEWGQGATSADFAETDSGVKLKSRGVVAMGQASESDAAVQESRPKLGEPPRFAVILHNDDYTTFDFVVEVLQKFFRKTATEAAEITLKVHHEGKGLAGVYSFEIAETKSLQVSEYSREKGHPLRSSVEPH
jgi:ATP-dependent Clp protease adaptor protein ClpS